MIMYGLHGLDPQGPGIHTLSINQSAYEGQTMSLHFRQRIFTKGFQLTSKLILWIENVLVIAKSLIWVLLRYGLISHRSEYI